MSDKSLKLTNRPAAVIAMALFAVAAVTYGDASRMAVRATYGMSANAASYFICLFFVALGLGHLLSAFRISAGPTEDCDWRAIGWIALALTGLIGSVWLHAGFVLGATLLFTFTARAFGRRALLADFLAGGVIGIIVFLFFNKLLSLALPQGPLERLLG
ncbi:tripartite tricarboxylate transporter TctB family protein [Phyllobacterium salinisoli]|uniref:Tripartite tricarboxylate transporter TctB family protein n=1 Tax=Phyllobacterium salinisoli TaxID=1899321 RepID=A0A368JYW7_9HYPH|nr:tripartite tricarboxylate transporter TctB family protein [Phyllobacterium salinisoli]RCS22094.1 tripartite tricarboxylate transporter TctB family protein [Phyllobacterium salinisoli]